ncbi:MAG: C1 family peptidase, partial [Candidatus Glassbacteria bacterium]
MARKRHLTFSLVVTLLVTFIASQYLSGDLASNEDELSQIKAAIQEKGARWVAQENEISMMDPDARRSLLGLIPETPEGEPLGPKGPVLETNLDWRDYDGHNWMTSVKNQYSCGSCVAFGAIAALEGRLNIFTGDWTWDPDLSEQHLFSCGGGICSFGWWVHSSMNYLQNYGVPEEECFVYWADDRPCSESCSDWEDHKVEIRDWAWVSNDQNTIKSYLQDGPLTTTMDVYTDFFYYSSGVYEHTWGSYEGGHCITFVGWDDSENYWICKNSWGWTWGETGYFRIRYDDSG